MLNAFRHHGLYRRHDLVGDRRAWCRVLNAFRHHGLYRGRACPPCSARLRAVLNAFRHHGLYRRLQIAKTLVDEWCSTPFGITDYIGSATTTTPTTHLSLCSTPFGITDYIGRLVADGGPAGCGRVLNAFRHHGLYRRTRLTPVRSPSVCSTPFGITDYIGLGLVNEQAQSVVLNAFRHHGLYRRVRERQRDAPVRDGCSTPFGITDYIGCRLAPPASRSRICAQRLSASRIISAT